ncbi:hypothetical protein CXQ85_003976 [Candidozyma haemuli]|uniref:Uncharacterized protein n=1 Tax=Candidozyma haemuli TaxID=45357 RepID=A0A2V1B0W9_9ASCO|nr:hypothetical protein CXQ85_003976 [[Candida] haemuloni]PVH23684.1 hypothetical protein CXQ85_003976 [[Candida] haemuloni]
MYQKGQRSNLRNHKDRKRRNDGAISGTETYKPLLLENPTIPESSKSIVEPGKVKAHLRKTMYEEDSRSHSSFMRVLLGNSECQKLSPDIQNTLMLDFDLSSVSFSESSPYSVDRIVTLYGTVSQISAALAYLSFVISSDLNNLLNNQSYTLKSQNYKIDILLEARESSLEAFAAKKTYCDFSEYDCNHNLNIVTLKGDLSYVMNTARDLCTQFPFKKYKDERNIKVLPTIRSHDYDHLFETTENDASSQTAKEGVLNFIYNMNHLSGVSES